MRCQGKVLIDGLDTQAVGVAGGGELDFSAGKEDLPRIQGEIA
jgi:hypothetical protein